MSRNAWKIAGAAALTAFILLDAPPDVKSDGHAGPSVLPFTLTVAETGWTGAPGLQSFASARTRDGKWLCVCGRSEGLHALQDTGETPPPSENFRGFNDKVWLIDPAAGRAWSRALSDLVPADVGLWLTVTNPQSVQAGDRLYVAGGYGFNASGKVMRTSDRLTVLDVEATADAVLNGGPIGAHVRQSDSIPLLRVTGGELWAEGGVFYLVFGQNKAGFTTPLTSGTYTFQVRAFRVVDDGTAAPTVTAGPVYGSESVPEHRRRDMNLVTTLGPDGRRGFTVFGGVFTPQVGAWTRPITFDPGGGAGTPAVDPSDFRQETCQYNCATLPLRDSKTGASYTVFFGGITGAELTPGGFRRDAKLPFTDLVSCVARSGAGVFTETLLAVPDAGAAPVAMRLPDRLGTGATFFPASPSAGDDPIDLAGLPDGSLVGYVYGGIRATQPHGGPTESNGRILAVRVGAKASPTIPVVVVP